MSYFLEQPVLFDRPIRLEPGERQNPFQVMKDFFVDYHLREWRDHLWNMVETCLCSDNDPYADAAGRSNLLQQYKDLERLLEAAWLLVEKKMKDPKV